MKRCLRLALCLACLLPLTGKAQTLSLEEAILLSLRNNPAICQADLNTVLQKFALELQQWQFQPHYSLNAIQTTTRTSNTAAGHFITTTQTGVQPGISLATPYGTEISLSATSNLNGHDGPGMSLQIMQPLLRGFGRDIVESALRDTKDQGRISALNKLQTVRQTVTHVIHAWLEILLLDETLGLDRDMLAEARRSLEQTRLFIKAGKKAGVEAISAQAAVATARATLANDLQAREAARHTLLLAIGLHPDTPLTLKPLNIPALIGRYPVFSKATTRRMALLHNPQYQIDQILLEGSLRRHLRQAEDAARWQLNLLLVASSGNGSESGGHSGFNNLVNGVNQTSSATLSLTVPIDDQSARTAIANSRIAMQQAKIALREEKWRIESDALNLLGNVNSAHEAISLAARAARLQESARKVSQKKYAAGMIDGLELQLAEQQCRTAKQLEASHRVRYLHALAELDLLTGHTLETWHIHGNPTRPAAKS